MRAQIERKVPNNSFEYFENSLITDNGFREYDVRWLLGREINPNGFLLLGRAYGTLVQEVLGESRVVVGHDFRSYSQDLSRSFIVGLLSTGAHVLDIGLALTPIVYFAQYHLGTQAAASLTASHNENGWTGLKLADGMSSTFGPEGILQFKKFVHSGKYKSGKGSYEQVEGVFHHYTQDLVKRAKLERPVRVVFAAGNGTAGRFGPEALRAIGCEVIPVDCEADWTFPNHNPNPEDLGFLEGLRDALRQQGGDIGIGLDGDGDRIGVVDNAGREVFSDKLGLLLARWMCQEYAKAGDRQGPTFVVDVKSTGLYNDDALLRDRGAKVVLWKTGHSYIKAKVRETKALAGFEKSGHWFLNEPYGRGYDDALLSAATLLKYLDGAGKPLSELLDELPRTWQSPTLGAECADNEKYGVVDQMVESYRNDMKSGRRIGGATIKDIITVNGVRFVFEDDSWGLVRASSNKPSIVVVAESNRSKEQLLAIIDDITAKLEATGKVGEYDQAMPR